MGALPDLGGEGTNVDTVEVEVEDEDEETYGEMLVRGGKILSHARRVMIEAEELLQKETITFPLRKMAVQEVMKLKVKLLRLMCFVFFVHIFSFL